MVRYLTRRGDRGSLCPVRSLAQTGHELVVVADSIDFCFEGSWFESRSSVRQGPDDSPYWLCDWVPRQPSPGIGTSSATFALFAEIRHRGQRVRAARRHEPLGHPVVDVMEPVGERAGIEFD